MVILYWLLVCIVGVGTVAGEFVDGEYLIYFEDGTTAEEMDRCVEVLEKDYSIETIQRFYLLLALHVSGSQEDIRRAENLNKVKSIAQNAIVSADQLPNGCENVATDTWGLDRIDQRDQVSNPTQENNFARNYIVGPYKGAGVTVYVVDTGIQTDHPNFGQRASWGFTSSGIGSNDDNNGHGTHVAGIIGSQTFGVAKDVTLVAVKVLRSNAKGTYATILEGLQWVLQNHTARTAVGDRLSVVSLSLSAPLNAGINDVIQSLVNAKAVVVVAAGNNNKDACTLTPASAPAAITVAAMNIREIATSFSNWGSCVDLFAPGMNVKSTFIGSGVQIQTGTSQAAAHVAGVAALRLSKGRRTPGQIKAWMINRSSKDKLTYSTTNQAASPNRLIYVNCLLP